MLTRVIELQPTEKRRKKNTRHISVEETVKKNFIVVKSKIY